MKVTINWHNEVFWCFEHHHTNTLTESMNDLIKAINRLDEGYSSEILRAKMPYAPNARISRCTCIRTTQWRAEPSNYFSLVVLDSFIVRSSLTGRTLYFGSRFRAVAEIFNNEVGQLVSRSIMDTDSERVGAS